MVPPTSKLPGRPVDYADGPWPDAPIRDVAEEQGGEPARYAVEQIARLVAQISHRREQRGLRRRQLATMTGLKPNTISNLENGTVWPDLRTVALIAWALEADLEFIPRATRRRLDGGES